LFVILSPPPRAKDLNLRAAEVEVGIEILRAAETAPLRMTVWEWKLLRFFTNH